MKDDSFLVWTQPADPLASDVMTLNGDVLGDADEVTRQQMVSWASGVAESADRRDLIGGGFLACSGSAKVAEIPARSSEPGFSPFITIGVQLSGRDSAAFERRIVTEVFRVAELAGYTLEPSDVHPVVRQLTENDTTGSGLPESNAVHRWRRHLWQKIVACWHYLVGFLGRAR